MSARELITKHLDLWTGAVTKKSTSGRGSSGKIELTGIKKLRELILELAVEGRLIQQDSNDKPASELLQAAADEKAQALKDKKIRKSLLGDPGSVISENDVPDGWAFTTLSAIGYWAIGNGFPKAHQGETGLEVLFCKVSDMNLPENSREIHTTVNSVSEQTAHSLKLNIHSSGTVIFPKIGGAISTNKRRVIIKPTAIDNNCLGITPTCAISSAYLYLFLTSVDMIQYQVGTSVPALSQGTLGKIPIKLPPLEEQHRIVQKVDELMALCDRLEQQTSDQLDAHETLVDTLLGTLTQSENASELADNWARLAAHFDTLFTTEQSIDKLKQAILQLAVMGRLVEQDAGDEPAASYLALSGIKATTTNTPQNWVTAELGTLGTILGGATPSKKNADYWAGEIPWVSPKDMKTDYISSSQDQISNTAIESTSLRLIPPHSLLMVVRGMILAHSFPVAMTLAPVTINQDMKALIPPRDLAPYLLLFLKAHKATVTSLVDRSTHGTCKLKSEKLWSLPVHVPPLAEQTKILQKVDELMALCDQLKKRLNQASETRCQLAEAVMKKAVS